MNRQPHPRLLVIGIDAADLGFIERNRVSLPRLGSLLSEGRLFRTRAPKALSGSVWPTFYNGVDPGVHGIYQHLVWDQTRMGLRRISRDWIHYRPFWGALEEAGFDVAVVDVPYSFPGTLKRGLEIMDWATHGQTWPWACNDPAYARAVRKLGRNPIGRETPVAKTPAQLERIRRDLTAAAALKAQLVKGILRDRRPDVLVSVFGEVHRGGHVLFRDDDERGQAAGDSPLLTVYQAVDRAVGEILEAVDPAATDVLLFSNHGMTRDNAQGHLVRPLMRRVNEVFLAGHGTGGTPGRSLVRYLRGHVPARLQHAVGAAAPDRVRQWVVERELVGGLDWSRTPGFALRTDIRTELRLNLAGREAKGMLPKDGREQARYVRLLSDSFRQLVDAGTGEPLVAEIVDTSKAHPGPRRDRLPDLVITWHDLPPARSARSPEIGEVAARPVGIRGGDHHDDGFTVFRRAARRVGPLPAPPRHARDLAGFITALATAAPAD